MKKYHLRHSKTRANRHTTNESQMPKKFEFQKIR